MNFTTITTRKACPSSVATVLGEKKKVSQIMGIMAGARRGDIFMVDEVLPVTKETVVCYAAGIDREDSFISSVLINLNKTHEELDIWPVSKFNLDKEGMLLQLARDRVRIHGEVKYFVSMEIAFQPKYKKHTVAVYPVEVVIDERGEYYTRSRQLQGRLFVRNEAGMFMPAV